MNTENDAATQAAFLEIAHLALSVLPSPLPARDTHYVLCSSDFSRKVEFRPQPTAALPWNRSKELKAVLSSAFKDKPLRLRLMRDSFNMLREVQMTPENETILLQCLSMLSEAPAQPQEAPVPEMSL